VDHVKLAGKVAIVTGTSPNIGGGIAGGLADEGATVVCVDLLPDNAQQCADWIKTRGRRALAVVCDVTDESQVEAMVGHVGNTYGGVDILVNNAGILGGLSVLEMPLERWNRQLAVNLTGTFLCTKHVARWMVNGGRKGSIIVIVSTAGHQGQAGNIGYSTSKSGLLNFTRAAAMDLARHGIRVNSLTPTATDAEEGIERGSAWGRPRPERGTGGPLEFRKMLPLGRLPSPRHYARAAVFLASDDSEMMTGFDLRVDGGAIAKYWPWIPHAP
jgi:NAD(P)-dependent dehydrogenase (short-subunit alcohol dehydrogenase family)